MDGEAANVPEIVKTVSEVTAYLSMGTLGFLVFRLLRRGRLLEYLPRYRVPWDSKVALLAMSFPLLGILAFLLGSPEAVGEVSEKISTGQSLIVGWGSFAFRMSLVVCGAAMLVSFWHANARDLGLPTSWRQLAGDVGIGFVTAAAVILPLLVVQNKLIHLLEIKVEHPLVEQLREHNSPAMMVLSIAIAAVAAPFFEEFTFRGLFQGWLERCEDEVVGNEDTFRRPLVLDAIEEEQDNLESELRLTTVPSFWSESLEPRLSNESSRLSGWFPPLPHGWLPILISGTVFGLAHLGHGVAPIPLALFGIALGYLYQRTHRLAPCIAAHMFFNGYSLLVLWLQLNATPAS